MRVNLRPRRRLVMRKSDLVEEREERASLTTTTADWLGAVVRCYLHCPVVGLRELLGCNVIVFDAVILQCRAYTHASAARGHIGHIRAAKCRDNCRAFPSLPSDPAASFFCFTDVISRPRDSPPPSSAKSHVLSITSTRNTSRCFNQRLALTFSLRDHLPRRVISAYLDGAIMVVSRLRGMCLVLWFNRFWKVATSFLNTSDGMRSICISAEIVKLVISSPRCCEEFCNFCIKNIFFSLKYSY
jgi:hypothetical protein